MPREIVFFGLFAPTLVPLFFLALLLLWRLDAVFRRKQLYLSVAHPALFRLAAFVLIFSLLGLCVYR